MVFTLLDGSIREGLFHEFKKHGEVTRIAVHGQGSSRYALVYFRRYGLQYTVISIYIYIVYSISIYEIN